MTPAEVALELIELQRKARVAIDLRKEGGTVLADAMERLVNERYEEIKRQYVAGESK